MVLFISLDFYKKKFRFFFLKLQTLLSAEQYLDER